MLTEQGIKFEDNSSEDRLIRQNLLAVSIVELNENVWTTRTTDSRTYGCEVIPAKENIGVIDKMPTEPPGQWHWVPNNPYDIITGACEINSWSFITMSNHSVLNVSLILVVLYLVMALVDRRTKTVKFKKAEE
ncbi:MAG: hypothetical protein PHQ86_07250, partial [Dehalococcoidales bacterium]|nr:hypothetical protein [Dehalococcoidales bacterium]